MRSTNTKLVVEAQTQVPRLAGPVSYQLGHPNVGSSIQYSSIKTPTLPHTKSYLKIFNFLNNNATSNDWLSGF